MIQRLAKKKRADWREFYAYEKQFLEYVTNNSVCLYNIEGCEPKYKFITIIGVSALSHTSPRCFCIHSEKLTPSIQA
ncbi:hypothetical protein [Photorhabdus luminescens]|uniref:Uncharacterized protein n=1 Tax=Photorhabdus luminescens subsp. mexicana TaxID=2100167 RepID=A0A4R4IR99_PHOLU|nr:hypothetical protein [Photorhabdus luminescens]TDB43247.1 hypothetical protein C5468_24120 [Photorhabdus luminescens subsp. mexicana]